MEKLQEYYNEIQCILCLGLPFVYILRIYHFIAIDTHIPISTYIQICIYRYMCNTFFSFMNYLRISWRRFSHLPLNVTFLRTKSVCIA